MTPERWQQIDQLFHEALAHEPAQRPAFLACVCANDEPLRAEVESLISSHEDGQGFIEAPAGDVAAALLSTQKPRLAAGQLIGAYKIVRQLASGGMGEVHLAIDTKLGRKAALKLLPQIFKEDVDRVRRFEQEARAASALNHPNILTIYEINNDSYEFIATEFVDGQTLRERLLSGALGTDEALSISEQIASALVAAHAEGIVHRDIKPENIMLRHDGIAKVLDFGLAKLAEDGVAGLHDVTQGVVKTSAGVVMGTTPYMSPEQTRGHKVDARTDIFSLGTVLYEMIAGDPLFKGDTPSDVVASVLRTHPPLLSSVAHDVPAALERIVVKALEKDREKRYQTVNEMWRDLRRLKQKREFNGLTRSAVGPGPAADTAATNVFSTREKTLSRIWRDYSVSQLKRSKVAAMAAVVLIIGIISTIFFYSHKAPTLTDKDTILIADFVNTTGDPVFDGTLKQALSVQLAQSPFLNIFSQDRVRETLAYMDKPTDERVTRAIGREICQRQGIKAMLIGSISGLGSHYVITLEAITQTGDSIAQEQSEAESKERVLASLGSAASRLRHKLGESLSSLQKYDVPIEQATTSSLEALKAFATGDQERAKGRERESLMFYQRAVDLDPNFAMAWARMGVIYGNQSESERPKQYVLKAYELRDRVSEPERLYISEKYYGYILGDIPKTIEVLQTRSRIYPNDYSAHNNLSLNYLFTARYEEAQKEAQEALRLRPNNPSATQNLIGAFLGLGQIEEAQQVAKRFAAANPDSLPTHLNAYIFAFLRRDEAAMNAEVVWARGKSAEPDFLASSAQTSFFFGQLKKGEEQTHRAVSLFLRQNRKENAAQALTILADTQALFGRCEEATRNIHPAVELSRDRFSLLGAAFVFALCRVPLRAQSSLEEAIQKFPQDTVTNLMVGPVIKALIESRRANHAEALKLLETESAYDFGIITGPFNNYARGQVYLDLKNGAQAAVEFQTIMDRHGIVPSDSSRSVSYLGLARAAALTGDLSRSRKAYQDFLALWKDADKDIPVLIAAKKEYKLLTQ